MTTDYCPYCNCGYCLKEINRLKEENDRLKKKVAAYMELAAINVSKFIIEEGSKKNETL